MRLLVFILLFLKTLQAYSIDKSIQEIYAEINNTWTESICPEPSPYCNIRLAYIGKIKRQPYVNLSKISEHQQGNCLTLLPFSKGTYPQLATSTIYTSYNQNLTHELINYFLDYPNIQIKFADKSIHNEKYIFDQNRRSEIFICTTSD